MVTWKGHQSLCDIASSVEGAYREVRNKLAYLLDTPCGGLDSNCWRQANRRWEEVKLYVGRQDRLERHKVPAVQRGHESAGEGSAGGIVGGRHRDGECSSGNWSKGW
jgi:hypothetical protein